MNALAVEQTDERTGQTRRIDVTEFRTVRVADYARTRFDGDVRFERCGGTTYLIAEERR
ncbi:hypothetical protein GL213_12730 [Halogeometricum borinquense]|uniref:hypothetical protein n=1 Tax=Halogeometricum borinquense TaxID=60847 RepID=UPI001425D47D|nr:hypothetical protein [Halogeometricum borinquense]QIQ77318.1 hypothetical protein GL213_12730 [Halogeometricum borinquense]